MGWRREIVRFAREVVDRLSGLSLATILAVTVAVRLIAGFVFPAESTPVYEFGRIARNVVDGEGYSYFPTDGQRPLSLDQEDAVAERLPSAYMPPLYTYMTVAATELGGGSDAGTVRTLRWFNIALACAAVVAVHALTRRLLGSTRAAALAALTFAVYPSTVYVATQVSAANLYIPAQLVLLMALLVAAASPAGRRGVGAGLALGALCLLRAEAVALIPLVAVWLWRASRGTTAGRRGRLVACFLLAAAVLPGAWLVRNSLTFGTPTTTIATSGGSNFWIGNHPGASGSQKSFDVPPDIAASVAQLPAADDFELRRGRIFREEAIDNIIGDPFGTIARDVKKLALLLTADIYDRRSLNPAYLMSWVVVAVLGALGLADWWREHRADRSTRVLVAGFLAVNVAVPMIFFVLARYKLPIEVALFMFAGGWLTTRINGERSRRPWRRRSPSGPQRTRPPARSWPGGRRPRAGSPASAVEHHTPRRSPSRPGRASPHR
jgi:hypothetical protein